MDEIANSKASQLEEVQGIQKAAGIKDLDAIKSQEALKVELKKQATAVAVDHFAGKEEKLKAAMNKIAKYKSKYPNVNSIADVTKKAVNPMKNKPFLQRVIPGINLQIQKRGENILVDFNPYAAYKFTGRIGAGIGWNQRVGYAWDARSFSPSTRIYGPRTFGEFKLGKGIYPRIEVEAMNTLVPPATLSQGDPQQRQWVWGAFTGIKKEYNVVGRVKGTATIMFRLIDPKHQSPYGDVVNARFRFELSPRKTKVKKR